MTMSPLGHNPNAHNPSVPCERAQALFAEAADPALSFIRMSQIRAEFAAMNCAGCGGAFETELQFRTLLASSATADTPSPDLAIRITESLQRIDLSQLDVTDIEF